MILPCLLSCALAADPTGVTCTVQPTPLIPGTITWTVTSPYQAGSNAVEILVPDGGDAAKRYPVTYILPVNAGTTGAWGHPLEVAKAHDLANRHQTILVVPSFAVLPWFGDNPQRPEYRQSSYVTEVVMPLVEARLPAVAEARGRYLVGFSKSGLGALGIFLRHPGRFAGVAVFETWHGQPDAKQWQEWGFADCYGTRENFDTWDPKHLLDQQRKELSAGPTRITVLNGGPGIRLGVELLLGQLRDRHVPHNVIANSTWSHTWTSGWLPLAVAALVDGAPPTAAP